MNCRIMLFFIVVAYSAESVSAEDPTVEMAIRWSQSEVYCCNLVTIDSVLNLLKLDPKGGKRNQYTVSYYEITRTENTPEHVSIIARKRVMSKDGKNKYQIMIKYRSAHSLAGFSEKWECPLKTMIGSEKGKYELDISVGNDGFIKRLHSVSCQVKSEVPIDFPESFNAEIIGLERQMDRVEIGDIKIESVSGQKDRVIEVSRVTPNSLSAIDLFYDEIAVPLIENGIVPDLENKSSR